MILAGDIGGTTTRLGLFSASEGKPRAEATEEFAGREHDSLEPILSRFLARHPAPIESACFGVAGPVIEGVVRMPNLPWVVEGRRLQLLTGARRVLLINDLEALAYGALFLGPESFAWLQRGEPVERGAIGIIAAGTGLGEALLFWNGGRYVAIPSEGGHADFAARTDIEIELLRFLRKKHRHVCCEHVVSGRGLANIFDFLRASGRPAPRELLERLASGDPAAAISGAALAGEAEIAAEALAIFVSAYGAEAGNLALRGKAIGGVYVGGGIAPKILPALARGDFLAAFVEKGSYRDFMERIPLAVIVNELAGLYGAAWHALASVGDAA